MWEEMFLKRSISFVVDIVAFYLPREGKTQIDCGVFILIYMCWLERGSVCVWTVGVYGTSA